MDDDLDLLLSLADEVAANSPPSPGIPSSPKGSKAPISTPPGLKRVISQQAKRSAVDAEIPVDGAGPKRAKVGAAGQ